MPLADNALLTLDEATTYLGAGASDAAVIEDLINRVSDYCEGPSGANRPLIARTFTALRYPPQWGPRLRPRATPIDVTSAVTVALDGTALTVWKAESDGDPADFDVVIGGDEPATPSYLYRACGWLGCAPLPIALTYTGGWEQDELPLDLKEAAYLILGQTYREQTRTGGASPDIQSYTPGPVTPGVTFRGESLIPMRAREILSARRIWNV